MLKQLFILYRFKICFNIKKVMALQVAGSQVVNAAMSSAATKIGETIARKMAEGAVQVISSKRQKLDGTGTPKYGKSSGGGGYGRSGYLKKKKYSRAKRYSKGSIRRRGVAKKTKKTRKGSSRRTVRRRLKRLVTITECSKKGSTKTLNISGSLTDSTAMHFGYSSYPKKIMMQQVAQAIVRVLLFDGCSYEIKSPSDTLQLEGGTSTAAGNYQIYVYYRDRAGIRRMIGSAIDITDGDTLQTVANLVAEKFYDFSAGNFSNTAQTDYATYVLDEIRLVEWTQIVTDTAYRTRALLDLNQIVVHYCCNAVMKWQNATNPNASGTASSDDVNALPLIGNEIVFNKYSPLVKDATYADDFQQSIVLDWPILKRAAGSDNLLKNVLEKKDFKNAVVSRDIAVNPGNFCLHGMNENGKKSLENFLKWIHTYALGGNSPAVGTSGGKFVLWSLKKPLTNAATMRLEYTVDYSVGCYISKQRNVCQLTGYEGLSF